MQVEIDAASLMKANAQFWEQMLNMQLDPVPDAEGFCVSPGHLMGCVSISGAWKGRIEVRLAEGLARTATAAMLMQPPETVSEVDALDAIREIANMIGGVIKSALPRPTSLSLPESSVAAEGDCTRTVVANSLAIAFQHSSGGLLLRVWEEESAP
ncbi:MAG: chemotaxis protein CheX [Terracidiphilus sp.]